MSQVLIEKIHRARQSQISVGGFTFKTRRPTVLEMQEMRQQNIRERDVLELFVTGWEGVKESDIIASGDDTPVEFSAALYREWIADRPDLWAPIIVAVVGSYKAYEEALDKSLKN